MKRAIKRCAHTIRVNSIFLALIDFHTCPSRAKRVPNTLFTWYISVCVETCDVFGPLCTKKASSSVCAAVMDTFELRCQKCRNEKNAQESLTPFIGGPRILNFPNCCVRPFSRLQLRKYDRELKCRKKGQMI